MRVIAGLAGGRKLAAPQHGTTRPTPERVREALFSSLAPWLAGARVLDVFAGSGALGIEALSRGAASATFVERDARCAQVLRRNLEVLPESVRQGARVVVGDALRTLARLAILGERFTLALVDAPFGDDVLARVLGALASGGLLEPGGRAVLEHPSARPPPDAPDGLTLARSRRYGSVSVTTYTAADDPQAPSRFP